MAAPPLITSFGPRHSHVLRLSKEQFLRTSDRPDRLPQVGGAYVDQSITLPNPQRLPTAEILETFLADDTGVCSPIGSNNELIDTFGDAVEAVSRAIVETLGRADVHVKAPGYVTVSVKPTHDVSGQPHFDDELYNPTEGVGVVGILATLDGTRFARNDLRLAAVNEGLPLPVHHDELHHFWHGDVPKQVADAERLVIAPQFGQLHAGPPLASTRPDLHRTAIVARFATIPAS